MPLVGGQIELALIARHSTVLRDVRLYASLSWGALAVTLLLGVAMITAVVRANMRPVHALLAELDIGDQPAVDELIVAGQRVHDLVHEKPHSPTPKERRVSSCTWWTSSFVALLMCGIFSAPYGTTLPYTYFQVLTVSLPAIGIAVDERVYDMVDHWEQAPADVNLVCCGYRDDVVILLNYEADGDRDSVLPAVMEYFADKNPKTRFGLSDACDNVAMISELCLPLSRGDRRRTRGPSARFGVVVMRVSPHPMNATNMAWMHRWRRLPCGNPWCWPGSTGMPPPRWSEWWMSISTTVSTPRCTPCVAPR